MSDGPDMQPVTSSMATHAGWDKPRQELHVRFQNGKTFAYHIPDDKAATVMGAASFGSALNKLVLGKHLGREV